LSAVRLRIPRRPLSDRAGGQHDNFTDQFLVQRVRVQSRDGNHETTDAGDVGLDHRDDLRQSAHVPVDAADHDGRVGVQKTSTDRLGLRTRRDRVVRRKCVSEILLDVRHFLAGSVRRH